MNGLSNLSKRTEQKNTKEPKLLTRIIKEKNIRKNKD